MHGKGFRMPSTWQVLNEHGGGEVPLLLSPFSSGLKRGDGGLPLSESNTSKVSGLGEPRKTIWP